MKTPSKGTNITLNCLEIAAANERRVLTIDEHIPMREIKLKERNIRVGE
jgi:hypothetical protein